MCGRIEMHIYAVATGPRNPFQAIAVPNVMAHSSPSHTSTSWPVLSRPPTGQEQITIPI